MNYCRFTTHSFFIITSLLFDYYIGPCYCIITTYFLLLHKYEITTSLLHHYYQITTIDWFHYYMVHFEIHYFMITSIANHYYPLLPLLPLLASLTWRCSSTGKEVTLRDRHTMVKGWILIHNGAEAEKCAK